MYVSLDVGRKGNTPKLNWEAMKYVRLLLTQPKMDLEIRQLSKMKILLDDSLRNRSCVMRGHEAIGAHF